MAYFFKAEEKQNKEKLSKETKLEVISKLENKSRRDCEKVLLTLSPQNASVRSEQIKPVSEFQSKVTVVLDDVALANLKRIQELASHKLKGMDLASVIAFAAEELVKKLDPEKRNNAVIQVPELEQRSNGRYIAARVKREVWVRDRGECQYQDPVSKRKCCSRQYLHYDHVKPFALGGETAASNLRLLCAGHNGLMAQRYFGRAVKKIGNRFSSVNSSKGNFD